MRLLGDWCCCWCQALTLRMKNHILIIPVYRCQAMMMLINKIIVLQCYCKTVASRQSWQTRTPLRKEQDNCETHHPQAMKNKQQEHDHCMITTRQYINLSGSYRLVDTGQYSSQLFYNSYANRIGNLHVSSSTDDSLFINEIDEWGHSISRPSIDEDGGGCGGAKWCGWQSIRQRSRQMTLYSSRWLTNGKSICQFNWRMVRWRQMVRITVLFNPCLFSSAVSPLLSLVSTLLEGVQHYSVQGCQWYWHGFLLKDLQILWISIHIVRAIIRAIITFGSTVETLTPICNGREFDKLLIFDDKVARDSKVKKSSAIFFFWQSWRMMVGVAAPNVNWQMVWLFLKSMVRMTVY